MANRLPKEFAALEPFVEKWALQSQDERQARRLASTTAELQQIYDAVLPHIPAIMKLCDAYPLGQLPPELQDVFGLALSLAEVAPHIELYRGSVGVPHSFEESRFLAKHGKLATWKAELPS